MKARKAPLLVLALVVGLAVSATGCFWQENLTGAVGQTQDVSACSIALTSNAPYGGWIQVATVNMRSGETSSPVTVKGTIAFTISFPSNYPRFPVGDGSPVTYNNGTSTGWQYVTNIYPGEQYKMVAINVSNPAYGSLTGTIQSQVLDGSGANMNGSTTSNCAAG